MIFFLSVAFFPKVTRNAKNFLYFFGLSILHFEHRTPLRSIHIESRVEMPQKRELFCLFWIFTKRFLLVYNLPYVNIGTGAVLLFFRLRGRPLFSDVHCEGVF